MKLSKIFVIGAVIAILGIANTVPLKAQQWQQQQQQQQQQQMPSANCGGYWGEGCMNPYQRDQLYRSHGYPEWRGRQPRRVYSPNLRAYDIGRPAITGYPTGDYRQNGQTTQRRGEMRYYNHHEETHYRIHQDGGSRLSVGDRCTMTEPHRGEQGYVWSDQRCHHLSPEYDR